jgi:hypothetical protein
MKRRAHWHYDHIDHQKRIIFIVDEDGPLSVTNDAERVCSEAVGEDEDGRDTTSYRLVYRDTRGDWDELVHDRGTFRGFRPTPNRKAFGGGL